MESEAGGIATAIVGGNARRRALFLSGSLGRGHDALADACAAVLDSAGPGWDCPTEPHARPTRWC